MPPLQVLPAALNGVSGVHFLPRVESRQSRPDNLVQATWSRINHSRDGTMKRLSVMFAAVLLACALPATFCASVSAQQADTPKPAAPKKTAPAPSSTEKAAESAKPEAAPEPKPAPREGAA